MDQKELKYWIAFSQFTKIGALRFKKLYDRFPSLEVAWQATARDLIRIGLEPKLAEEIIVQRSEINPDFELEKLERENIKVITIKDKNYPKLLKEIYDPPALLYYKGNLKTEKFAVGVVGTRKISQYGRQITPQIVKELALNGVTIVSGLALGIDALAHQATLEASGKTIAVLGSGLDQQNIYPADNRYLAQKIIASGGAVISEYPVGTLPLKLNFPHRNRIISGLTLGILVIEAPDESGALITAKFALEQNREVFAVPGNIYNQNSIGTNNLIKSGARLVSQASDILEELNLTQAKEFLATKEIIPGSKEEEELLKLLSREPIHIDKLIQESKLEASVVNSTLAIMEMKGQVRNLSGNNYVLAR